MANNIIVLSAFVLHALVFVHGHRYGADPLACDSMKPGHGTNRRQTRATPYIIDANLDGYVPCTTVGQRDCGVIVRIRSRRMGLAQPFKGFLLQARSRSPDGQITYVGEYRYMNGQQVTGRNNANQINQIRAQGQFGAAGFPNAAGAVAMGQTGFNNGARFARDVFGADPNATVDQPQVAVDPEAPVALPQVAVPPGQFNPQFNPNNPFQNQMGQVPTNVIVQRMQCVRGTGVTHTENSMKTGIQLLWTPPVGFNRPIQFVATVVQDYNTFWMGHRSRVLRSRPLLRTRAGGVANTARWFNNSGASTISANIVLFVTGLCSVFYLALRR